jgi:hypothetical protein
MGRFLEKVGSVMLQKAAWQIDVVLREGCP